MGLVGIGYPARPLPANTFLNYATNGENLANAKQSDHCSGIAMAQTTGQGAMYERELCDSETLSDSNVAKTYVLKNTSIA